MTYGIVNDELNENNAELQDIDGDPNLFDSLADADDIVRYATEDIERFVEEYRKHKKREHNALDMRNADKERARVDETVRAISFDLQAILQCPYAAENQL